MATSGIGSTDQDPEIKSLRRPRDFFTFPQSFQPELNVGGFVTQGRKQREEDEKGKISPWYFQGEAKDVRPGCHEKNNLAL